MKREFIGISVMAMILLGLFCGGGALAETPPSEKQAADLDMKMVNQGRYLTRIAGCNDCHTPGHLLSEGMSRKNYGSPATGSDGVGHGGPHTAPTCDSL